MTAGSLIVCLVLSVIILIMTLVILKLVSGRTNEKVNQEGSDNLTLNQLNTINRNILSNLKDAEFAEKLGEELSRILSFDLLFIQSPLGVDIIALDGRKIPKQLKKALYQIKNVEFMEDGTPIAQSSKGPVDLKEAAPGIQNIMFYPLVSSDKYMGIIGVCTSKDAGYTSNEKNIMGNISRYVSVGIDNAMNYEKVQSFLELLSKEKKVTEKQREELKEQQVEILDSIKYGRRIQRALLSYEEAELSGLPEHFIIFQPKNIVSGDFYWTKVMGDWAYMIVADCTGHGVPGAFLTMLGASFLNEITAGEMLSPASVIDHLRHKVIENLHQKGRKHDSMDGMDISVLLINRKEGKAQWSGAHNPLYHVKPSALRNETVELCFESEDGNTILEEHKGDRQSVGFNYKPSPFVNHEIEIHENDLLYILTDGYPDQFGGGKGKKFKYQVLKKLLLEVCTENLLEQRKTLNHKLVLWKGDYEQTDDICLMGIKV